MTHNRAALETLGDPALAELSRADDDAAFAELWRRHARAGTTAARQFTSIADPQDIVSEAYLRILRALQQGGGPHEAFRPYLYRTIRNIALDWRASSPSLSLDETHDLVSDQSIEITVLENAVTARAFEALPENWQAVLWYLEVEGMSPSEAAPLLGLSPNATSALAARAQEGFKRAWLQAHVNDRAVPAECQWTTARMGRYVRHSLSGRTRARFDQHLKDCDRCAVLVLEIGDLGGQLASVLLPITLGATAGSLLLAQLRDHAGAGVVSALAPMVAPSGTAIVSGAVAVALIASGAVLVIPPAENPAPSTASGELPPAHDAPSQPTDSTEASTSQPPAPPSDPDVPQSVVATPPAAVEPPTSPAPPAPPAPADAPLIDLSVSLLGGAVGIDAAIDLGPSTGLLVEVLPGLGLPGLGLLGR